MTEEFQITEMMTRYLLGDLPQAEREALEAKYFADSDLLDLLDAAELDLIEGYVRDKLSAADRAQFEKVWLNSPARHEKLQFVQSLALAMSQQPMELPVGTESNTWRQTIAAWFALPRLAAAVVLIGLLAGGVGLVFSNWQLRQKIMQLQQTSADHQQKEQSLSAQLTQESERARQLNNELESLQERLATLSPKKQQVSFFWTLLGLRQAGDPNQTRQLNIPADVGFVQLGFKLPTDRYQSFQLELQTMNGDTVWQRTRLEARNRRAVVNIRASQFANGTFRLVLTGKLTGEDPIELGVFPVEIVLKKQR